MNNVKIKHYLRFMFRNSELIFWIGGLSILILSDPCTSHFSLCLFKLAGVPYCPGCGLGHSIGFLFRGEFSASFSAHPLGIPALFFILLRLYRLVFNKSIFTFKKLVYGFYVHDPSKS